MHSTSFYLAEKTAPVTIFSRIVLNSLWSEEEQADRQQIVVLMLLWLHTAILARMVHLEVKRWRIGYLVTFFIIKLTRSEKRQENALRFGKLAKFQALSSMFYVFKPRSDGLSQKLILGWPGDLKLQFSKWQATLVCFLSIDVLRASLPNEPDKVNQGYVGEVNPHKTQMKYI